MEATTAIAIYAAGLSTAIAAAQFARWALSRRSTLQIDVDEGWSSPLPDGFTVGDRDCLVLWIDIINRGEREEQIAWVFVEVRDGDRRWGRGAGVGGEDQVRPGQRKTYIFAEEAVAAQEQADMEIDAITGSFRVCVLNGTGEEFLSPVQSAPSPTRA